MSIRNCIKIVGDTLCVLNKQVFNHRVVVFNNCWDVKKYDNPPEFPVATSVIFDRCNDTTMLEWINKETFPKMQILYVNSPVRNPEIFKRLRLDKNNEGPTININDRYIHNGCIDTRWLYDENNHLMNNYNVMMNLDILKRIELLQVSGCDVVDYVQYPKVI